MNEIWKLIADPNADPTLLRVFRWLMQWPEAMAAATMLDTAEVTRSTGLRLSAIDGALSQLVGRGCLTIHAERSDGARWYTLRLNGISEAAPALTRPRREKVPQERVRSVSPGLRWIVLERDGRRCRACGAGVENGAKLVIDHVKPFSKGGLTTEDNLQVLCYDCNAGKFDRWRELA